MFKKILVLAPHTDDGEMGCGGSIAKFIEEGKEVFMAAFSTARQSLRPGLAADTLVKEIGAACNVLGIRERNLVLFDFQVRHFPSVRQEILEELIKLKKDIQPDLIMLPASSDIHQDHQVISAEGMRAFKQTTVLGYEEPWNNQKFVTNGFVCLEERHIAQKIAALQCYQSQSHRDYLDEGLMRSLARIRGSQFQVAWAEAFEVMRLVLPF